jgi:hypothetical protein
MKRSGSLLPGETADVEATVTDPENLEVTLAWSVNCGYYGNINGSEFITPSTTSTTSGPSGTQFSAVMTAPDSLSYPIEYCEITLVATDLEGLFSTATRWVPVAASFEFQLNGVAFGTDGLPLADASMAYTNFACDADGLLTEFTTTDENGQYQFVIDLASCISQYGGFSDLGEIQTSFMFDGRLWESGTWLNDYYYGGNDGGLQSYCTISPDGATVCDVDINLPVLWGPVIGNVYLPADIDPVGLTDIIINSFQGFIFGGYSYSYDFIPLDLLSSPASFGPIMAPVGELFVEHAYQTIDGGEQSQYNNGDNSSTDGVRVDIGNILTTVPIVISIFDTDNLSIPDVEIDFRSFSGMNGPDNEIAIQGTTNVNGEFMANVYLGSLGGNSLNPFHYFSGSRLNADSTKYIDLGGTQECLLEGQLVDVFGVPIADVFFSVFGNTSSTSFLTDNNGDFSTTAIPGYFYIEGQNYQSGNYYGNNQTDNCRPAAG